MAKERPGLGEGGDRPLDVAGSFRRHASEPSSQGLGVIELHLLAVFILGTVLVGYLGWIALIALWPTVGALIVAIVLYLSGHRGRGIYLTIFAAGVIAPVYWLIMRLASVGALGS